MLKQAVQALVNLSGYQITKLEESVDRSYQPLELPFIDLLDLIIRDYQRRHGEVFFVQIGAHDGKSADPVRSLVQEHHLSGILVEPQPQTYQKLLENYRHEPQLKFENAVISDRDGVVPFYVVKENIADLPFWLSQSASLDRTIVRDALYYWRYAKQLTTLSDDLDSMIQEIQLPALTIQTLLAKHHIQKVDLLVIDTMGFDFQILKMFPFQQLKPAIIQFEHSLLSPADQQDCFQLLANQGYSLAKFTVDTIAYLHGTSRHWTIDRW